MNVKVTFRGMKSSDAIREYLSEDVRVREDIRTPGGRWFIEDRRCQRVDAVRKSRFCADRAEGR